MNDTYFKDDPRPTDEFVSSFEKFIFFLMICFVFSLSLSVFDSSPIPYPKREFITDDDNSDATNAHVSKTEPPVVKTEQSTGLLNQQQSAHVTHSQQTQNVHIKQQNNIVQQTHAQQVNFRNIPNIIID